jgi:hypothetical protein
VALHIVGGHGGALAHDHLAEFLGKRHATEQRIGPRGDGFGDRHGLVSE